MNEITEQLKQIIVDELDINADKADLRDDISLFEGGIGLDSIAVMELISILERTFGFEFSDEELNIDAFKTLTTLTEFVTEKITATED